MQRLTNESIKDFAKRILSAKENGQDIDNVEAYQMITGKLVSSDEARKRIYGIKDMLEQLDIDGINNISDDDVLKSLEDKKREVQIERIKLQTEKLSVNEQIRTISRTELVREEIQRCISGLKNVQPPLFERISPIQKVCIGGIADAHFGKDIVIRGLMGEDLNVYNEEVFEKRMWKLLSYYIKLIDNNQLTKMYFVDAGDSIEGILRLQSLQQIKYGIVESTVKYANFMITWLNELSKYIEIDYYGCLGNHNEIRPIGTKSGELPKENMQYVVDEMLRLGLINNSRIKINKTSSLHYFDADGIKILATHGQAEKNLCQSVKDYKEIYGVEIDYMITGHLHNSKQETATMKSKVIQFPSLVGIDDYSISLKRTANAEGKMIIVDGDIMNSIDIRL